MITRNTIAIEQSERRGVAELGGIWVRMMVVHAPDNKKMGPSRRQNGLPKSKEKKKKGDETINGQQLNHAFTDDGRDDIDSS